MKKIEPIPLNLDLDEIRAKLPEKQVLDWDHFKTLLEMSKPLIAARAVYKVSYILKKGEDAVDIDGILLRSRVLRNNLDKVERVFPYVATIGASLEEKAKETEDLMEQYYLDIIGNIALTRARGFLADHLRSRFAIEGLSFMSPGSLDDWPLEEQRPLFLILGDPTSSIGVRLNESLLMIPKKSLSGIYFPTEITFHSCQLCSRDNCIGRRAPYNETLAREHGILPG
ncbi:MAG: vitamin B12 dependent methionine synthase [Deltaproteobacteria bacterium]|nr:vitamin B12 dependent methionine synthase [Deltaproteobacteria bacterium]